MQEWIIAMLVISMLLIIRDMAKTILKEKKRNRAEILLVIQEHPQRDKVQRCAEAFRKLADTFYGMPYRKDYFSDGQVEQILSAACEEVCSRCFQKDSCWEVHGQDMLRGGELLVRTIEHGDEDAIRKARAEWMNVCGRSVQFLDCVKGNFRKEKQNLLWDNRMIENRMAVAQQLSEISEIIHRISEDLYDISFAEPQFQEELGKKLARHHILLKQAWVMDKVEGRRQVFLMMRTRGGICVPVSEAAQVLSDICRGSMVPAAGSRCMLNGEMRTIHFVEDVSYRILYGSAKMTKDEERVSGDSFVCHWEEPGKFIMCLSDGMGSGIEASRESEMVVELLEQFLESGFSEETAVKMVNSSLLFKGSQDTFSTVDICVLDLYSGVGSFLKAGAAASFIRRNHCVESITSESLAAGLMQQMEFETSSRKLYHGDYVIMMTDGVLDALPAEREEETMKEIILDIRDESPRDISRGILERVLGYTDYRAKDDMTVLVAGMWKK